MNKHTKSIKRVSKPWGYELWISDGQNGNFALKKIMFRAGNRTSLQVHRHKFETTYVLSGHGSIFVSKEKFDIDKFLNEGMTTQEVEDFEKTFTEIELVEGTAFDIEPGYVHRVVANTDLVFIEASTTELDDVIRLQDDQGRQHGKIEQEHQ